MAKVKYDTENENEIYFYVENQVGQVQRKRAFKNAAGKFGSITSIHPDSKLVIDKENGMNVSFKLGHKDNLTRYCWVKEGRRYKTTARSKHIREL